LQVASCPSALEIMWYLAVAAGLWMFRGKIGQYLGPFLPQVQPTRAAFYLHGVLLIAGVLYVIPFEFVGLGFLKRPSYLASMWATTLGCILTLKGNYGSPPFPDNISFSGGIAGIKQSLASFSMQLQPWLQKAMMSVDFHFLFFSLIFLAATPSVWVLLILGRRSLWSVCTVCAKEHPENRLWLMFAPTWAKLQAQNPKVLEYSALAEVLLGLWLTVAIFLPMRQILTCVLYWNYLRMRYQVPRSHEVHKKAWEQLEGRVAPLFKMVPLLNKPLDMAKGWFTKTQ